MDAIEFGMVEERNEQVAFDYRSTAWDNQAAMSVTLIVVGVGVELSVRLRIGIQSQAMRKLLGDA